PGDRLPTLRRFGISQRDDNRTCDSKAGFRPTYTTLAGLGRGNSLGGGGCVNRVRFGLSFFLEQGVNCVADFLQRDLEPIKRRCITSEFFVANSVKVLESAQRSIQISLRLQVERLR